MFSWDSEAGKFGQNVRRVWQRNGRFLDVPVQICKMEGFSEGFRKRKLQVNVHMEKNRKDSEKF